ncbi:MAG: sigma-70 family RNA polymerase sigma factor [Actinomycetota bacterium]
MTTALAEKPNPTTTRTFAAPAPTQRRTGHTPIASVTTATLGRSTLSSSRTAEHTATEAAPTDLASFDRLYEQRYEPMVRLACRFVDRRAVAEDVVQDSFRQLWQKWGTVTSPASYLRTSVVNGCHNELRRRRVRRDSWHKLIEGPDAESDYLADALASIPEPRRRALVLRFYGGQTMQEIAEVMDVPIGTVKSLIHRGLADLRGVLN